MGKRSEQRIVRPVAGMVILEDDHRATSAKRIIWVGNGSDRVITRAGRDGSGRRADVLVKRLYEGRYRLLSGGGGS